MCIDLYTAGLLSKETLIAQIPYVVSVDDELKLIEKGQNLLNENSDKTDKNDEEDINNE
jgi:hypothetical protein